MMLTLKIFTATMILLLVLSCPVLTCQCQTSSTEQAAKNLYQSFLTKVFGLDLTKYYINTGYGPNHGPQSGINYGLHYPPEFGGAVKEEGLACALNSSSGMADSSCILDNGTITSCTISAANGSLIYVQPPPSNMVDAAKNYLERYEVFVAQMYSRDTAYLQQALSCLDGLNVQIPTRKVIGNMSFELKPYGNTTYFLWTYSQGSVSTTFKNIELAFGYNSLHSFRDSWNLYSVSNVTPITEADAKPFAYSTARSYNLTLASFQGSTMIPVQAYPDWSNMTYKADFQMARGVSFNVANPDTPDLNVPTSSTVRDPLTLYPFWHFIFYFSKPIGGILGIEVGVWADTKEIDYCHAYGYLGMPPNQTPQLTDTQSSNGAEQTGASKLQPEYAYIMLIVTTTSIAIGSYLIVRKRKNK